MVTPLNERPKSGPYSGLTARSARRFLTQSFAEVGLPFAEEDALEIVLAATGLDKTGLILRGTETLDTDRVETIKDHMNRRLAGEPVDHILGWREFFGRRFQISKDVLSPRADTEGLIRGALSRLKTIPSPNILDLGTGSGAIGLTLLAEKPAARLIATDVSGAALEVAKTNAKILVVETRINFSLGSWWRAVPKDARFDMILSNPPYITDKAMEALEGEVAAYDPELALRGGADGLEAYRIIISEAGEFMNPQAWLGLEIGYDQGAAVLNMLSDTIFTNISLEKDLGGLDRVIWAQKLA